MDPDREFITHKCSRTDGYRVGLDDIYEGVQNKRDNPISDRQYDCLVLSSQNGGHQEQGFNCVSKASLGNCHFQSDHDYCRVPPREVECMGGLGFQKLSGLKRMASVTNQIPSDLQKIRESGNRSICVKSLPPPSPLRGLEGRSPQSSNRCFSTTMEVNGTGIRISSLLHDREGAKETEIGGGQP